jgi:hypothetical protein
MPSSLDCRETDGEGEMRNDLLCARGEGEGTKIKLCPFCESMKVSLVKDFFGHLHGGVELFFKEKNTFFFTLIMSIRE